jgi:predicted SAM-dependent methyltransferase
VFDEIYRTLRKGGLLRIVVIDLSVGMKLYLKNPEELTNKKYPKLHGEYPDLPMTRFLSWCGSEVIKMSFDRDMLKHYLGRDGFDIGKIRWLKYNECSDVFVGKDRPRWDGWSIYMETEK